MARKPAPMMHRESGFHFHSYSTFSRGVSGKSERESYVASTIAIPYNGIAFSGVCQGRLQAAGGIPRHLFCSQGFHMSELSIMCVESGEWGKLSEYYLITLVLHDQEVRNI